MYPTNYLGRMSLCKVITLLILKKNKHRNHENGSHKNKWNMGVLHVHMDQPPIPLIKIKHDDNLDKDFVKLKLRRYTTS